MAQYNKPRAKYSDRNNDVFEVVMIADKDGTPVGTTTPLPVTLGSENITINGSVNIGSTVEITNDHGNPIPTHTHLVDENDNLFNHVNPIPVTVRTGPIQGFFSFNNFGLNANRGWTMSSTNIPMFAVRVKPGSGQTFRLINYDIGNNNANQSTIGYTWYNAPTITGPDVTWVEIGTSGIEYAIYHDSYNSNTPNAISGGALSHGGIVIGKSNSDMTPEMADAVFTDGGMTMVCAVRRLDSSTKLDVWFTVTLVK